MGEERGTSEGWMPWALSLQMVSYEAFLTRFYSNLECTRRSISLVQRSASKNGSPTWLSLRLTGRAGENAVSWAARRRSCWRSVWGLGVCTPPSLTGDPTDAGPRATLGKWPPYVSMNLKVRRRWSGPHTIVQGTPCKDCAFCSMGIMNRVCFMSMKLAIQLSNPAEHKMSF